MKQKIKNSSQAGNSFFGAILPALALFYFWSLLFALSSCSDPLQRDDSDAAITGSAIGFTTSVPSLSTTRGTPIASAASLTDMGVFCYHTGFDNWATAGATTAPNKMNQVQFTQSGGEWSTASPVSWGSDVSIAEKFTFWAYAPYATADNGLTLNAPVGGKGFPTLTYTVPSNLSKQPDLMVATAKDIHPTGNKVNLAYKHALTCIAFKAKGSGQKISSVKVKGVSATGTLSVDAAGNPVWSNLSAPGTIAYTAGLNASEITTGGSLVNILNADGYLMMVPQTLTESAELVITMDGEEYTFKLNTQDITTWAPGKLLTYGIDADKCKVGVITDYRDKNSSNCYIINPSTTQDRVYKIPVKRLNEFWASPGNVYGENNATYSLVAGRPWVVSLLWSTSSALVKTGTPTDAISISKASGTGPDDYFELTVPSGMAASNRGNFTVQIVVNSLIVWTWHFWVTDYNPYSEGTPISVATEDGEPWVWDVDGGKLLRFSKSTDLLYKGKRFMDRAVGYVEGQMPMLYQYGRMNPFPNPLKDGAYYTVNTNYLYLYASAAGITKPYMGVVRPASVSRAISEPKVIYSANTFSNTVSSTVYAGPYDWCSSSLCTASNICWNDPSAVLGTGKKSLFDPSPYGFKVPEPTAFYSLSKDGNSAYDSTDPQNRLFTTTRSADYTFTIYSLGDIAGQGAMWKSPMNYYYSFGSGYWNTNLIYGHPVGNNNAYWTSRPGTETPSSVAMNLLIERAPSAFGQSPRAMALPVLCIEE